jgi:exodeoxyribonuclease-3
VLTVTSVNVNGLRAAARKGFVEWLAGTAADVVCLQEVRAEREQLPEGVRDPEGWHAVYAPAAAKGRAGVALFSRREPERVQIGFGSAEFDTSGRYIEADLPGVTVASLYLPSGEVGTDRQDEKVRFMGEFHTYVEGLRARAAADGREVLICGDWNIAHQQADLKNWRANQKSAGFLPEERAWLSRVFDESGYVDVVRAQHLGAGGPVLVVVVPRSCLRQRHGLAHRLPRRHAGAGRPRGEGVGRARGDTRRALERPRAGVGGVRVVGRRGAWADGS